MENNMFENKNEEPTPVNPVVEEAPIEAPIEAPEVAPVAEPVAEVAPEAPAQSDAVSTNSFARSEAEPQIVGVVENGAIGVAPAKPEPKKSAPAKKAAAKKEKVAIHSTKNVTWSGVGKVYTGYNIVDPEEAEKWLTRNHVRRATPEEVAKEFGK